MKEKIIAFFTKIMTFFLSAFFIFSTFNQNVQPVQPVQPEEENSMKLALALMADVHMEGNCLPRFELTSTAMKNLEGS